MALLSALLPDVQSRIAIRDFTVQTTVGVTLMLAIFVVKMQTLSELGQVAVRIFTFYSIVDSARALLRRDHVWGASLNCWDQAATYFLFATFLNVMFDVIS